jgi:hypothetical protein
MSDSTQGHEGSNSNDFTLGFLVGSVFGGIMTYLWFVPEGKDKVKDLLEHGLTVASELEQKMEKAGEEIIKDAKKIEKKEKVSAPEAVVESTKKRFFKKKDN